MKRMMKISHFVIHYSTDASECKVQDNSFVKHLCHFFSKNESILSIPTDFEKLFKQTRNMQEKDGIINTQVNTVSTFISNFWGEVASRCKIAGLEVGPTSYSEAPAEGVFSVIESVMSGREKLSLQYVEALTRVALEGPRPSTKKAFDVSGEALLKREVRDKERFITQSFMRGMISKTVMKIQNDD